MAALDLSNLAQRIMASHMAPMWKAMVTVAKTWRAEEAKLQVDKVRAQGDYNEAHHSTEALKTFVVALWPKKVKLMDLVWPEGIPDEFDFRYPGEGRLPDGTYDDVPVPVSAGCVEVFRKHMPVLAGRLFELSAIVDSLPSPVSLNVLFNIIATAMSNTYLLLNDMTLKEHDSNSRLRMLECHLLEARRQHLRIRCACRLYRSLFPLRLPETNRAPLVG